MHRAFYAEGERSEAATCERPDGGIEGFGAPSTSRVRRALGSGSSAPPPTAANSFNLLSSVPFFSFFAHLFPLPPCPPRNQNRPKIRSRDSVIYEARCPKLSLALGYGSASSENSSPESVATRRRSSSSSAASAGGAVDPEGRAVAAAATSAVVAPGPHASTNSEASSSNNPTATGGSASSDPLSGGPLVAVKVYERAKLSPSKLRAVRRETAMMIYASRKGVPSTVRFLAAFDDEGKVHIVMEACGGGDLLERLLHEGRAFSEARAAAEVAAPLLHCLASLHALSIVHRDVKLENVFVGDDGRVRLGDFGLTLSLKQELAISPVGTVEYMAPEIVALPPVDAVTSGAVLPASIAACDEKVDVWALGVTLYELLTGALCVFFFPGSKNDSLKRGGGEILTRSFPLPFSLFLFLS